MAGMGTVGWILYIAVIVAMFYFFGILPQQK